MGGQPHASSAFPPRIETRYLLCSRLGGDKCRYGPVRKFSPPPSGIRSPDLSMPSILLYRLPYSGPPLNVAQYAEASFIYNTYNCYVAYLSLVSEIRPVVVTWGGQLKILLYFGPIDWARFYRLLIHSFQQAKHYSIHPHLPTSPFRKKFLTNMAKKQC